jgi:Fungal specific transcription factor domain
MTSFYETPDDQKDMWHWMGVTLSLAQTIGLHRDPKNSKMESRQQSLWKRIWWTCFMRDRMIALGTRRPMRIGDEDFDMPMLTLDDFETQEASPKVKEMLEGCSLICDTAQLKELSLMCIQKSKLCVCIGKVLKTQYAVRSHKLGRTMETTITLLPKNSQADICQVEQCEEAINDWYDQQPPGVIHNIEDSLGQCISEVITVHRAVLSMVHLALCNTLHRPRSQLISPSEDCNSRELQDQSRHKVRIAANHVTRIVHQIHEMNLTRYLPTSAVTVILSAIVIHLLDAKSDDYDGRRRSVQRYQQCMEVLQRLREIYVSADFATAFLEAAVRRANVPIPCCAQGSEAKVEMQAASLFTLTPPPDASAHDLFSQTSVAPADLVLVDQVTPPASDETDGSASFRASMLADDINSGTIGDMALDTDFDALFDLDADMNVADPEGPSQTLAPDAECKSSSCINASGLEPSFSRQSLLCELTRVPVHA